MVEIRDFGRLDFEEMSAEQQHAASEEVWRMARAMYKQCQDLRPTWMAAEAAGMLMALVALNAYPKQRENAIDDMRDYALKHLPTLRRLDEQDC